MAIAKGWVPWKAEGKNELQKIQDLKVGWLGEIKV
jgi:hypothetical protein